MTMHTGWATDGHTHRLSANTQSIHVQRHVRMFNSNVAMCIQALNSDFRHVMQEQKIHVQANEAGTTQELRKHMINSNHIHAQQVAAHAQVKVRMYSTVQDMQ